MNGLIRLRPKSRALVPAAAALCFLACSSSPKMTPLMEYAGVKYMTTAELRIRMHEFAVRYPVLIEEAAYRIESGTDNPEVYEKALLWKIYAIPAYNKAMFRIDPYAALIDTWVLSVQMKQYFESGPGAGEFGQFQQVALDASAGLERELATIAGLALGGAAAAEASMKVEAWALDHPIESHFFIRDSVIPLVAGIMAGGQTGWSRGFESLEESIQELRMRLTIYTDIIPRQVQWQLELASIGIMESEDIQNAFEDISKLRGGMDRLEVSLAAGFDGTAGSIAGVSSSISGGFDRLGGTLVTGIRNERIEALAGLSSDMEPVLQEVKRILDEGAADYEARTKAIVNQIFWRGLILIAAFFAGLTIYGVATAKRRKV